MCVNIFNVSSCLLHAPENKIKIWYDLNSDIDNTLESYDYKVYMFLQINPCMSNCNTQKNMLLQYLFICL